MVSGLHIHHSNYSKNAPLFIDSYTATAMPPHQKKRVKQESIGASWDIYTDTHTHTHPSLLKLPFKINPSTSHSYLISVCIYKLSFLENREILTCVPHRGAATPWPAEQRVFLCDTGLWPSCIAWACACPNYWTFQAISSLFFCWLPQAQSPP